jgi:hypothetical protein
VRTRRRRCSKERQGLIQRLTQGTSTVCRDEAGLTLVELIIVIIILPILVGGIAVALIGILQNESNTFSSTSDSGDAQITSANFIRDVQSASLLTTGTPMFPDGSCRNGSYPPTGSTPLVGLQWTQVNFRKITDGKVNGNQRLMSASAGFTSADNGATVTGGDIKPNTVITWNPSSDSSTSVTLSQTTTGTLGPEVVSISLTNNWEASYWDVHSGSTSQLVRMFCEMTASGPQFISKGVLAHDLPADEGPATITCGPSVPTSQCTPSYFSSTWASTSGISDVSLSSFEPGSGFQFNLSATPRGTNPTSAEVAGGASAATSVLVTGPGASLAVPVSGDVLTIKGSLVFNTGPPGTQGYASGAGTLKASAGPIWEYNCGSVLMGCSKVTSQFSGSCNCATPTSITAPITPPVIAQPSGPGPSNPGNCSTAGSITTCQPGYYASHLSVSGNVVFANGNYVFNHDVDVAAGIAARPSVTFGTGQYTFNNGLNIAPAMAVTGNGVFFYVLNGSVSTGAGDTVNLTPPVSGPSLGVLIYQPLSNTSAMTLGSASSFFSNSFGGAVEAPGAMITLGSTNDSFSVASLVAANITMGSSNVNVTVGS